MRLCKEVVSVAASVEIIQTTNAAKLTIDKNALDVYPIKDATIV